MNWEAITAISEIIGAVAVVVSLIYLAGEVRQNTRAIRGSTLDSITAHQQFELHWSSELASIWKKCTEDPDSMSFEESWRISEWMTAALTARQNEFHQYRQGLLDTAVWESIENIITLILGSDWARGWWRDIGRQNLSEEFVAEVELLLEAKRRDASDVVRALDKESPG
jgi:hypothetical protein